MTCSYKTSQGTKCQFPNHVDDLSINHCNVLLYCPDLMYDCKKCHNYHNCHTDCYRDVPDAPQCKHCGAFHLMNDHWCAQSKHHVEALHVLDLFSPGHLAPVFESRIQYEKVKAFIEQDDYDISIQEDHPRRGYPQVELPSAEVQSFHCLPYYGTFVVNMLRNQKYIEQDFWKRIKISHYFGDYYVMHGEDLYKIVPTDEEISFEEWFQQRARVIRKFVLSGAHWLLYLINDATDCYVRDWKTSGTYDEFKSTFTLVLDEKLYKCSTYERCAERDDATCWSAGETFECLEIKYKKELIFDGFDQLHPNGDSDSEEYTEQLDEGEADNEVHPNKALAKTKEEPKVRVEQQPAEEVQLPSETKSSNQALDEPEEIIGENCGRKTIKVDTPSGSKEAIVISDRLDIPKNNFTLNVPLPEIGNVWTSVNPVDGVTGKNYPVSVSWRTQYLMNLFTHHTTGAVFKLVAKIPMFQSQKFWVSFIPAEYTPSDVFRLAGFEWNPSEMNEIYVVVPWSSSEYMLPVNQLPGRINISPITDLVTAEGLASPIEIAVYCCPHKMQLYIPKIVNQVNPPPTSSPFVRTVALTDTTQLPVGTQIFPIPSQINTEATLTFDEIVAKVTSTGAITKITLATPTGLNEFTAVNCTVAVVSTSTEGPMAAIPQTAATPPGKVKVYKATTARSEPTFEKGDGIVIYQNLVPGVSVPEQSKFKVLNTNDIATLSNETGVTKFLTVNAGQTSFSGLEGEFHVGRIPKADIEVVEPEYTEQIFEYSYQAPGDQIEKDHGKTQDHTRRLDRHFQVQNQLVINKNSDVTIVPLYTNVDDDYPFYDAKRHLYFGGFPVVKLVFNSIPTTNALLRFTLVDSRTPVSLEDALQLPGIEVDPKVGSISLLPWWCYKYPLGDFNKIIADSTNNWTLQCHVLSGSFGAGAPIRYGYLYNTSHLQYSHLRGVDSLGPPVPEYTEQMLDSAPPAKSNQQGEATSRPEEGVSSDSERRWNFVSSFKVPSDVALVEVPINRAIMGGWFHIHNSRYQRWRGNLKLKVMINNSALVNGNIHITQANTVVSGAVKVADLLEKISYSSGGAPGKPYILDVEWRNLKPWLLPTDTLGSLFIAIPQRTANSFATSDSFQFTIYADVSDIELTMPIDPKGFSTWPGITVTTYKAAAEVVDTLALGTNVCR